MIASALSDTERLTRIGEILAVGVGRLLTLQQREHGGSERRSDGREQSVSEELADESSKILRFLTKVGSATPSEIRSKFGLSRTTAYRRLKDLEKQGLVKRCGKSRDVVYEIAA